MRSVPQSTQQGATTAFFQEPPETDTMSPHTPAALGQRKASPSLPRRALLALVATLACGAAMPLQAQPNASGWPTKPVKLVVG